MSTTAIKIIISKFRGTCRDCGGTIQRGEHIAWSRKTGAIHETCAQGNEEDAEEYDEDAAAGFEPGTLASDRRLARNGLTVVRFSSGETMTQNSRGRCEDAPCCGCCS